MNFNSRGFSIIEVILSLAIFALFATAFLGTLVYWHSNADVSANKTRAVFLAEEGLEIVRNMRDESFSNLVDGTHGISMLSVAGKGKQVVIQWAFSGTEDITGIFHRQIIVSTIDPTTKKVESEIFWKQNSREYSMALNTLFTDYPAGVISEQPGGGPK